MNFTSALFLFLFLPIFFIIYFLLPNNSLKNIFLLISSLYFYSTGEPIFVYVLILSIIVNYFLANKIHSNRDRFLQKKFLITSVIFNFSLLAFFKYINFVISTINSLLFINISLMDIPLPIGISFFTFQAISYVFDVYYDDAKNDSIYYQRNILEFALYISMFPQLVAGPIVRYSSIAKDIKQRKFNLDEINVGLKRFVYGLSKKVLIANSMAIVADRAFLLDPKDAGFTMLILGAISYTFQIYFDFSGYCDMAIGLGKMLGFNFPENFNNPYKAKSITDFWRRWHITLSSWFRDYIYFPLGGSKGGFNKTIINLLIVWVLTGLWHGAKWNFVLWGLLYCLFISFEKYFKLTHNNKNIDRVLPYFICRLYTMVVVVLLWVIFRSNSIKEAFIYIFNMFNFTNSGLVNSQAWFYLKDFLLFYIFAFLLSTNFFKVMTELLFKNKENSKTYHILNTLNVVTLLILCTFYIVKGSYNPFIYFNF